jgi:hypothetical protein
VNEFRYDAEYDPPLPVCDVVLIVPATDLCVPLTAIVDTAPMA